MSILSTVIVTLAIALLFRMALVIVILVDDTAKLKPEIVASLISIEETLGEERVNWEGNWMMMVEPEGTSCVEYGVGLRLISKLRWAKKV